ncbi:hypothetical protein GCM10009127_02620 [Alteraurantiacibacter aestuarii]|uniref:Cytochrome c domain-containing protein n=1 Tax=Alteraurantiacibacter aestuarii TaxID=650004 RepID=A0A844ZLN7_9SPHN|nr:c-type cytochrome [Alteraurantiacibacter aestuarii]MXO88484.1 hypothetical protein [Alteraurantiacibacter aestuarii]
MTAATPDHIAARTGSPRAVLAKLGLPCLLLALAACATTTDGAPYAPDASMGMLIARDSCAECHATGRTGDSPNEDATAFREIAGRPAMTQQALAAWLTDGHNYPAEMGFTLEQHQIESLAAFMIRLRAGGADSAS